MKIAHITNGDNYNEFFEKKYAKTGISFSEALIQGNITPDIFSEDFFSVRAKEFGITLLKYKAHLKDFIRFINELDEYSKIYLYFGLDTFCQINMLAILAFLEKKHYLGELFYMQINESDFAKQPLQSSIALGEYFSTYQKLLINKEAVQVADASQQKAYNLYVDYISENGKLVQFIKNNKHLNKKTLLKELFAISEDYGLGDIQLLELISKHY